MHYTAQSLIKTSMGCKCINFRNFDSVFGCQFVDDQAYKLNSNKSVPLGLQDNWTLVGILFGSYVIGSMHIPGNPYSS